MFMDTATNQTNNQNTNLANTISIGSTDSGNGGFSPTNDNTNEFKASNDLGASVGVAGGTAGGVGMSRGEERAQEETFDGYTQAPQSDTKKIITYVLIAVVVVVLSVLGGSFIKRKKR